jgi:hypothetical protein
MSGVGREFRGIGPEAATRTIFVGVSLSEGVDVPTHILGPRSR